MRRFRFRLSFFLLIGVFAHANPGSEQRILELKGNPSLIDTALVETSTASEVSAHFKALFSDPGKIRDTLNNPETPRPFKVYLVKKIAYWLRSGKLPSDAGRHRYVLAMLSAFRDSGPIEELRGLAYSRLIPLMAKLNDEEKSAVLNSLRQHQSTDDGRVVALPALVFLESLELTSEKLDRLAQYDIQVQQRVLEALARERTKKNIVEIQMKVVPFVSSVEEKVREAAASVLHDPSPSTLAKRDRLFQEPLALLSTLLADSNTSLNSARLIAKILGANRATTIFEYRSVQADEGIHASLTSALESPKTALRQAAADALEQIKPPDVPTQLALAKAVTSDRDNQTALTAFRALGGDHRYRGDHRIRDNSVKQVLLDGLSDELERKTPRADRIEWVLNLLDRNPLSQLDQVNCLAELYPQVQLSENRARIRDIIENSELNKRDADQSLWTHATVERMAAVPEKDALFDLLAGALNRSGASDSVVGQLLSSQDKRLRAVGVRLFTSIPKNRFAQALHDPTLVSGLASFLLERGNFEARKALLTTLLSKGKTIESAILWKAIIANLKSTDKDLRSAAAAILSGHLSVRGRERGLPLGDSKVVEDLKKALAQEDTMAVAQRALDALAKLGCREAVAANGRT